MAHSTDILLKELQRELDAGMHSSAHRSEERPVAIVKPKSDERPIVKAKEAASSSPAKQKQIPDISGFIKSMSENKVRNIEDKVKSSLDQKFKRK